MKPRTCHVHLWISNDQGEKACYSVKPLHPDELAPSAAGFFLTKLADDSPLYAVRVAIDGSVSCNCPQFNFKSQCKHSGAVVAAGILPVALLSVLRERTQLLNHTEAEVLRLTEAAVEERQLHDHDTEWRANRIADMNEEIDRLEAELLRHKPKPRRRAAQAA